MVVKSRQNCGQICDSTLPALRIPLACELSPVLANTHCLDLSGIRGDTLLTVVVSQLVNAILGKGAFRHLRFLIIL